MGRGKPKRWGIHILALTALPVLAVPALTPQAVLARRAASETEVAAINRTQSENALEVVVGPSAALLAGL